MVKKISETKVVTKEVKIHFLNMMKDLSKGIPIKWDRVIETENRVNCYGWILKEGTTHFDFVLLFYDRKAQYFNYLTSSVKYSKTMLINWGDPVETHIDCILFDEYFKEVVK